ncbi:MAG: hypothetical protein JWQ89_431, partial [Devosia sp.]|uniref:serine/threonine protein kinase n=1 Tax=Devosia sp. TaxID=1871048 RepID=UPI0026204F72
MAGYPSMDQYNDAVQHPGTAFTDTALKAAKIAVNGMGLPVALGGGFALTYTAAAQGRKYAVRCFHKEAKNLESRYSHVATGLRAVAGRYFVGFEYQARGVLVNGQHYPIVKMDWVEGDTLGVFLEDNHKDKARLERLRTQFGEVERFLRSKGMAHGDLQNGNVLVKSDLKLIDYDGVYVPALPTGSGAELGHKHFQHPKRAAPDFGPNMDRFSFSVIDLSLRALAAQPALFDRYSNGENIILTANDFLDPSNSGVFSDLKAIPALTKYATDLANICAAPMAAVPSLEDYLAGRNIPATSIVIRSPSQAAAAPKAAAAYVGAFDVVDGSNYDAVSRQIGNRVELVGQVVKVHLGRTKRGGRPYAFVFFNHTSRGVRVNIWNDGLDKLTDQPGHGWMGRWLSVQGLVDPPYSSKYGTSVSITITSGSQIRTIPEFEARRRLRAPSPRPSSATSSQTAPSSNADILRELR